MLSGANGASRSSGEAPAPAGAENRRQPKCSRIAARHGKIGSWVAAGLLVAVACLLLPGCGQDDQAIKGLSAQVQELQAKIDDLRSHEPAQPVNADHQPLTLPPSAGGAHGPAVPSSAGFQRAGLPTLLSDVNPRIRRGAALLIAQFADPALKAGVIQVADANPPPEMAATTVLALSAYLDDPAAVAALKKLLATQDYKQLKDRVDILQEVHNPALAPVLLEVEKSLATENIKDVDWDLVTARRSLVTVMGAQGNPVVVPRMLDLIRTQSLAAQQAAAVLLVFHDDKTIAPALATILQAARENPPARIQTEFSSVYNALMVARKIPGPEALTQEMIFQLYNPDNNLRSLAYYGLRDWPYEKRAELLLKEVLDPANETEEPNMKGTKRWELVMRLLYETNQPDTDLALAAALHSPNPEIVDRALLDLRDRSNDAVCRVVGGWLKAACQDKAFLKRDEAGQDFENAVAVIANANERGGFTLTAPLFDVAPTGEYAQGSSDAKKQAKRKSLDNAQRTAVAIFGADGALTDCPALQTIYNKLPKGDLKSALYNACQEIRWPIAFSADQQTLTVDQAKLDAMLKNQKEIPKVAPAGDQF
ncbi:MAG: hypothetical protein ACREJ2_02450 [Planctomycetota bacterium]